MLNLVVDLSDYGCKYGMMIKTIDFCKIDGCPCLNGNV